MSAVDPRRFPLIPVRLDQLQELLAPALNGRHIATVDRPGGGLTNTIYRVTPEGDGPPLLVRIFAGSAGSYRKEYRLLTQLRGYLIESSFLQVAGALRILLVSVVSKSI